MEETSFGHLDVILKECGQPKVEHLQFCRSGRFHKHSYYESFTVLKGTGVVEYGENKVIVKPGDTVTIAPNLPHRMIPDENEVLEGILWYHDQKGEWYN